MTSKILNQLTDEQIDLVHGVTNDICKAKGYATTVKRTDVELVLQAMLLINRCSLVTRPPNKSKKVNKPNANSDTNPISSIH